jgi:hypothetical protein
LACRFFPERQAGRHRYYSLTPEPLTLLRAWLEPYEQFWRARLPRLAALLEKEHDHD